MKTCKSFIFTNLLLGSCFWGSNSFAEDISYELSSTDFEISVLSDNSVGTRLDPPTAFETDNSLFLKFFFLPSEPSTLEAQYYSVRYSTPRPYTNVVLNELHVGLSPPS